MLCSNPFVRTPVGVTRKMALLSDEARLAATPFPCGQCLACRINRSRVWQHRIMLESYVHSNSCFVTLTYDDENVPEDMNLKKEDYQKFLKRLRYYLGYKFRYFLVGEYGEKTERPHFHVILFGVSMGEKDIIDRAWNKGYTKVGDVSKDSARYMTGYCVKGWTSDRNEKLRGRVPEFMRCSKHNGGIGYGAVEFMKNKHKGKDLGVVRELAYGKKKMPLGRYLSHKMNDENDLDCAFWDYQEELFDRYLDKGCSLKDELLEDSKQKRLQVEKRNKIFKQKRSM